MNGQISARLPARSLQRERGANGQPTPRGATDPYFTSHFCLPALGVENGRTSFLHHEETSGVRRFDKLTAHGPRAAIGFSVRRNRRPRSAGPPGQFLQ